MKRPNYYYKTWRESAVGLQLQTFLYRCNEASEKSRQWAEQQGADSYIESPDGMAGGIAALIFDNSISVEGFEKVTLPDETIIFVPTPDSDLEKEMYALPIVSETEIISIMQFKPRMSKDNKPLPFTFGDQTPILFLHNGWWYINVPYESDADSITAIDEREFYKRRLAALNTM